MKTTKLSLAIIVFGLIFSGCTRKEEEKPASVNLSFPKQMTSLKNGTLSNMILGHLVVNVSGAGISSPIVASYDMCHECTTVVAAPNVVTLDVPQGDGRLFQVLAVYMDEESKEMDFFYGDRLANISGTEVQVPITVSSLGGGATITTGNISGRILNESGTGPSGDVLIKYYAEGKPGLIIEKSVMAAGWFSFFGLRGTSLRYEMADGTPLFGGQNISLDSAIFNPTSQVMRVTMPQYQRKETYNSSTPTLRLSEPEVFIFGFWGPGAVGKPICYESMTGSLDKVLRADQTSVTGTQLTFAAHDVAPPANLFAAIDNVFHQGGVASTAAACTDAVAFSGKISVKGSQFNGEGKDAAGGLKVPFRPQLVGSSSSPQPMLITQNQGSFRFAGQLLPGVTQILSRIEFFKYVGPEANNFKYQDSDRGFPCFEAANKGFVPAGGGSFDADGNFQISSSALVTEANNNNLGVGYCFITSSGQMVAKGGYLPPYAFNYYPPVGGGGGGSVGGGGGGGNVSQEADSFRFYQLFHLGAWGENVCHPLRILLVKETGGGNYTQNVVNSTVRTVSVAEGTDNINISLVFGLDEASCASSAAASINVTFQAGETEKVVWLRGNQTVASTSVQVRVTSGSGFATAMTQEAMDMQNKTTGTLGGFRAGMNKGFIAPNSCYEFEIFALDTNGVVMQTGTAGTFKHDFNDPISSSQLIPTGLLGLYENCSASTAIAVGANISFPNGASHRSLAIKTDNTFNQNLGFRFKMYSSPSPTFADFTYLNIPPVVQRLNFAGVPATLFADECYQATVEAKDMGGSTTTATSDVPFWLMGNPQWFNSATCNTGSIFWRKRSNRGGFDKPSIFQIHEFRPEYESWSAFFLYE